MVKVSLVVSSFCFLLRRKVSWWYMCSESGSSTQIHQGSTVPWILSFHSNTGVILLKKILALLQTASPALARRDNTYRERDTEYCPRYGLNLCIQLQSRELTYCPIMIRMLERHNDIITSENFFYLAICGPKCGTSTAAPISLALISHNLSSVNFFWCNLYRIYWSGGMRTKEAIWI